jgi:hypothetical protein
LIESSLLTAPRNWQATHEYSDRNQYVYNAPSLVHACSFVWLTACRSAASGA